MNFVTSYQGASNSSNNKDTRHWPGSCWTLPSEPSWPQADPQGWLWQTWPLSGSLSPSAAPHCAPSSSCLPAWPAADQWCGHCNHNHSYLRPTWHGSWTCWHTVGTLFYRESFCEIGSGKVQFIKTLLFVVSDWDKSLEVYYRPYSGDRADKANSLKPSQDQVF